MPKTRMPQKLTCPQLTHQQLTYTKLTYPKLACPKLVLCVMRFVCRVVETNGFYENNQRAKWNTIGMTQQPILITTVVWCPEGVETTRSHHVFRLT